MKTNFPNQKTKSPFYNMLTNTVVVLLVSAAMFSLKPANAQSTSQANSQSNPTIAIKDFRSLYTSLLQALNVEPTEELREFYVQNRAQLPLSSDVANLTSTSVLAVKKLVNEVCQIHSRQNFDRIASHEYELIPNYYSRLLLDRDLNEREVEIVLNSVPRRVFSEESRDQIPSDVLICTLIGSSLEFLLLPTF